MTKKKHENKQKQKKNNKKSHERTRMNTPKAERINERARKVWVWRSSAQNMALYTNPTEAYVIAQRSAQFSPVEQDAEIK